MFNLYYTFIFILNIEPYKCTGIFSDDFNYLCKQYELSYTPINITKLKLNGTTISNETKPEKSKISKKPSENQSMLINNNDLSFFQRQLNTSDRDLGKSLNYINFKYWIINIFKSLEESEISKSSILFKDHYEYFKPKIQVDVEIVDKHEVLMALYIRGNNFNFLSKNSQNYFYYLRLENRF